MSSTPQVAGALGAPLATTLEDPVSEELIRTITRTSNHVTILRQRSTLAHENLQLSLEETQLTEDFQETRLRQTIIPVCRDPRDMFTDLIRYVRSMSMILDGMEPFRTMYHNIVDANIASGLWEQDKIGALRVLCLWQSFAFTDTPEADAPCSRTLLRDHVIEFLTNLRNPPGGYCPIDRTPVLPFANRGICAGLCHFS